MKAERINGTFQPIAITLETQGEVNQLWAIFNHARIVDGTSFDCDNPLDQFSIHPDRKDEFEKLRKRLGC